MRKSLGRFSTALLSTAQLWWQSTNYAGMNLQVGGAENESRI